MSQSGILSDLHRLSVTSKRQSPVVCLRQTNGQRASESGHLEEPRQVLLRHLVLPYLSFSVGLPTNFTIFLTSALPTFNTHTQQFNTPHGPSSRSETRPPPTGSPLSTRGRFVTRTRTCAPHPTIFPTTRLFIRPTWAGNRDRDRQQRICGRTCCVCN